jgi:hypothetical protein
MPASRKSHPLNVFPNAVDLDRTPTSQDGLGFGRSVEVLANHFAPSLTTLTATPAYFALLSAGLALAGGADERTSRGFVLRLERVWALGSALAEQNTDGMRGTTFAHRASQQFHGRQKADLNYPFFRAGTQARQGVWGAYLRSAERLGFHRSGIVTGRGELAGGDFVEAVRCAPALVAAVLGRRRHVANVDLIDFAQLCGWRIPVSRSAAQSIAEGLCAIDTQRQAARCVTLSAVDAGQSDLLADLQGWQVGIDRPFETQATGALRFLDFYIHTSRILDAMWWAARRSQSRHDFLSEGAVVQACLSLEGQALSSSEAMELAGVPSDLTSFSIQFHKATPEQILSFVMDRHLVTQEGKGQSPWLRMAHNQFIETAHRNPPRYDPFDPATKPPVPDLRLVNLKRMSDELTSAGARL